MEKWYQVLNSDLNKHTIKWTTQQQEKLAWWCKSVTPVFGKWRRGYNCKSLVTWWVQEASLSYTRPCLKSNRAQTHGSTSTCHTNNGNLVTWVQPLDPTSKWRERTDLHKVVLWLPRLYSGMHTHISQTIRAHTYIFLVLLLFVLWDRVSVCSPGWPRIHCRPG